MAYGMELAASISIEQPGPAPFVVVISWYTGMKNGENDDAVY